MLFSTFQQKLSVSIMDWC